MRILHIINNLNTGGAEKLLVDSIIHYNNYGITADLYLLSNVKTPFFDQLQRKFLGKIYSSNSSSIYSPLQIKDIGSIILSENYDLIHVHLFPALYWTSLAKKIYKIKKPMLFTEHSTSNTRMDNCIFKFFDKIIYKAYDVVTAITPEVKKALITKLNLSKDKIKVIYNGIDLSKFREQAKFSKGIFFEGYCKILIQVSRFEKEKDQNTVIKALLNLPVNYKLLLVGDGSRKLESENLVKEMKLESRVKFLGVRTDIPKLLNTSDVVILSSHWEGFGLAAIEGMAAGKPVIVSDVNGLSQVVGDNGIKFTLGDSKELAEKIVSLEKSDLYNFWVDKSLERSKEFDISKMIKENIELYKQLVNNE